MVTIRWSFVKLLTSTLLLCFFVTTFLLFSWLAKKHVSGEANEVYDQIGQSFTNNPKEWKHKLAVLVPFRDRFEELMEFVPHIHSFLNNASIEHHIYIINQADKLRFNRAALINVGYKLSVLDCDYLVMHDVDLLPLNPLLDYGYPEGYVFHVAAPNLHPLYHYKTFVGGILILTHQDYSRLNGLSNRYWGWGREDDEFYVRMKEADIIVKRPDIEKVKTGNKTFRHVHDRVKRPRDNKRYGDQKKSGGHRDRITGLQSVDYTLTERYDITIHKAPATVYNIELACDRSDTPWCENPY
ncbi:beta-1,4-galactosyltransferase 7-like [Watersipora subatra]|uniref:beta-1,4-galactosyltransferase 7-like n=1 Tax=Watersipora subatra TaxID=2589382 RepID=UPI00355C312D